MIVGGLIDVFASSFLGAVSVVGALLVLRIANVPPERDAGLLPHIVHENTLFIVTQIVIGAGCSLMGGYIAARLARHDFRLNGALSSFLGVGSSLVSILLGHDSGQVTLQVALLPLKPALGYVGGYLWERSARSKITART